MKINLLKLKFCAVLLFLLAVQSGYAQTKPALPEIDRIRIAEAFRLGQTIGNRIWKDWNKAPFAVLLITPDTEFLIRHPQPSKDFTLGGYDSLLQSNIYYRPRVFSPNLLATFPAVGGIPTIVIGEAENTSKKTSTEWVVTMLHEHFHQLQTTQPDYQKAVDELKLAGGDQNGQWMLNYAFPYSDAEISKQFDALSRMLAAALEVKDQKELFAQAAAYFSARHKLEASLAPADARYFSFQIWQEGVARYTEYHAAAYAARYYRPSRQFRALKDYQPFKTVADKILANILDELKTLKLGEYRRVAFYPLGAGEALLLDRTNQHWRRQYFKNKFHVDEYFKAAYRY